MRDGVQVGVAITLILLFMLEINLVVQLAFNCSTVVMRVLGWQ